jgi:hypothetical protein
MTTPLVKCAVSNCSYWAQGNNCQAETIMIEIDQHAKADFHAEFGDEFGYDTKHKDNAKNVANTCCHTFKAKQA